MVAKKKQKTLTTEEEIMSAPGTEESLRNVVEKKPIIPVNGKMIVLEEKGEALSAKLKQLQDDNLLYGYNPKTQEAVVITKGE